MLVSAKVSSPYTVILVEDESGGEIPEVRGTGLVDATDSCIGIGCRPDSDGDTEITLGNMDSLDPGTKPAFEGKLKTPSRTVVVRSVLGDTFLKLVVPSLETRVRVWADHPFDPSRITVGVE